MTTDDITKRFTASEALLFCRFIRNSLTLEELGKKLPGRPIGISSADSFPKSSTGNRSGTSGSACSESGTDDMSTLPVSLLPELTDKKTIRAVEVTSCALCGEVVNRRKWLGSNNWLCFMFYFTNSECQVEVEEL